MEEKMKITPDDLSEIRKGLSCQMLKMRVDRDERSIERIEDLLTRLDVMEKEFYKTLRNHN
tara:strand:+ start:949 stop:1131 length:183 start_codon:yes stop_codon:yes gene_type:complete